MVTTESNSFEIERRIILFKPTTTLPDESTLGYDGDPNDVINGNTAGETLICNCPINTRYSESDGSEWTKRALQNTWVKLGSTTLIELDDTPSYYVDGKYLRSTVSGTEWVTISGGVGTSIHSDLSNLAYDDSGHIGFASSDDLTIVSGTLQFEIDGKVSNEVYSSAWNGVVDKSPSKNVIYDEMEDRMVVGVIINGGNF